MKLRKSGAGVRMFILGLLILGCGNSAPIKKAPDFGLQDLNGNTVTLSSLKGKVVILDFWATWCPPCRRGIPDLNDLYHAYKDKGVEILGISLDQGGKDDIVSGMQKYNITIDYSVLIGNAEVARLYGGIPAIPTTFILDKEGNIVNKYVGLQEKETFTAKLDKLIAGN